MQLVLWKSNNISHHNSLNFSFFGKSIHILDCADLSFNTPFIAISGGSFQLSLSCTYFILPSLPSPFFPSSLPRLRLSYANAMSILHRVWIAESVSRIAEQLPLSPRLRHNLLPLSSSPKLCLRISTPKLLAASWNKPKSKHNLP